MIQRNRRAASFAAVPEEQGRCFEVGRKTNRRSAKKRETAPLELRRKTRYVTAWSPKLYRLLSRREKVSGRFINFHATFHPLKSSFRPDSLSQTASKHWTPILQRKLNATRPIDIFCGRKRRGTDLFIFEE
jgi:hypothetical protein